MSFGDDPGALSLGHCLQLVPLRFRLHSCPSPVPFRDQFHLIPLRLCRAAHRRVQLPLAPHDLLLLYLDLLLPFYHFHFQLFRAYLLACLGLLQRIRQLCFRSSRVDLLIILRFLDLKVALRFCYRRVRAVPRRLPRLLRLRRLDPRVPLGLCLSDRCIALHLGRSPHPQRLQVPLFVLNVPNREANDFEPHIGHIGGRHVPHLVCEGDAVSVDLLHCHRPENRALLPFQRLQGDLGDFYNRLAEKLLGRRPNRFLASPNLHLRHAVDRNRHSLLRIHPLRAHLQSHHF